MASIFKTLVGAGAAAVVLGLTTAAPASASSFGEVVPDGPERSVIDPNIRSVVDPNIRGVIDPNY